MADKIVRVRLQAIVSEYQAGMRRAKRSTQDLDRSVLSSVRKNEAGFTALGLAAGATGLLILRKFRDAAREASKFEATIAKMTTQVGIARDEARAMGDAALRMGDTGKGPQELGEALFFVTSAGLRGKAALDVLEASAQASSIGLGDTATVADLVTSAVNAYGPAVLSAERATDTLIGTVREGKAEAPALAGALGRVLPVASQMGVRFDEVGAAVAAMTRTGSDAATATTQLRAILVSLIKPANESAQQMAEFGLSAEGLRDTIRRDGLWAALMEVRDAVGQNDEAIARIFPNVRALAGFLDLTGANAAETEAVFSRLEDTTGFLSEGFAEWGTTTEAAQARFSAAMEAARVSLGQTLLPAITDTLERATDLVEWFNSLDPATRAAVGSIVGVTGALLTLGGASLLALVALARVRLAMQQLGLTAIGTAGALGRVTAVLRGPWGLAIGAAVGMIFAFRNAKHEARAAVEDFIAALQADNLAIGQNTRQHAIAALRQQGALKTAQEYGLALDRVTDAALGDRDAHRELHEQLTRHFQTQDRSLTKTQAQHLAYSQLVAILGDVPFALADARREAIENARAEGGAARAAAELALALEDVDYAASRLTPGISGYTTAAQQADAATGDLGLDVDALGEGMGAASDEASELEQAVKDLQKAVEGMASPGRAYQALLEDLSDEERTHADELREATLSGQASWREFREGVSVDLARYAEMLEQQNSNIREWERNLVTIAARGGAEFARSLAETGEDGVDIVAELVDASDEEFLRFRNAWVESAQLGGEGFASAMLDALDRAEELMGPAGARIVNALAEKLGLGAVEVGKIVEQYGRMLEAGLNPVISAVGGKAIVYDAGNLRDAQARVPRGAVLPVADGGVLPRDARIQPPGTLVQWAEPETHGESFIPLARAKRPRSRAIWLETGRRLGIDLEPTGDGQGLFSFHEGGFRSSADVPLVPGVPPGALGRVGGDAMGHARRAAVEYLDRVAPRLGTGIGWQAMWQALSGRFPWAQLHSAFRPGAITATGNRSYHALGRALDVTPSPTIAEWIRQHYMPQTRELIFSPLGRRQIRNGRDWRYSGITRAMHWDHVHWAMARGGLRGHDGAALPIRSFDQGGFLPPGVTLAHNGTGVAEAVGIDYQRLAETLADALREQGATINVHGVDDPLGAAQAVKLAVFR